MCWPEQHTVMTTFRCNTSIAPRGPNHTAAIPMHLDALIPPRGSNHFTTPKSDHDAYKAPQCQNSLLPDQRGDGHIRLPCPLLSQYIQNNIFWLTNCVTIPKMPCCQRKVPCLHSMWSHLKHCCTTTSHKSKHSWQHRVIHFSALQHRFRLSGSHVP